MSLPTHRHSFFLRLRVMNFSTVGRRAAHQLGDPEFQTTKDLALAVMRSRVGSSRQVPTMWTPCRLFNRKTELERKRASRTRAAMSRRQGRCPAETVSGHISTRHRVYPKWAIRTYSVAKCSFFVRPFTHGFQIVPQLTGELAPRSTASVSRSYSALRGPGAPEQHPSADRCVRSAT
jgi:hypothetical protein